MAIAWVMLVAAAAPARADFKEWSFAITPAYSWVSVDTRSASGGGFAVDAGFGISESLTLRASGFLSWHALPAVTGMMPAPGGNLGAFAAMLGLNYSLDVIRLVPSFDIWIGALGLRGSPDFGGGGPIAPSTAFGLAAGFNLDYLITRHWAVGVTLRYHALISDLSRIPAYLFVGPRVLFRFGGKK